MHTLILLYLKGRLFEEECYLNDLMDDSIFNY